MIVCEGPVNAKLEIATDKRSTEDKENLQRNKMSLRWKEIEITNLER